MLSIDIFCSKSALLAQMPVLVQHPSQETIGIGHGPLLRGHGQRHDARVALYDYPHGQTRRKREETGGGMDS